MPASSTSKHGESNHAASRQTKIRLRVKSCRSKEEAVTFLQKSNTKNFWPCGRWPVQSPQGQKFLVQLFTKSGCFFFKSSLSGPDVPLGTSG
jgi:hypothetical protein